MGAYAEFLERKAQLDGMAGFKPLWMPDFLFPFQQAMTGWAIRQGRGALFADCGLGKGPMALVWAQNVYKHTGKPVLPAYPPGRHRADGYRGRQVRGRHGDLP